MHYELIRSRKRRTLSLSVKDAQVIVQAPQWLPRDEIDAFVIDKHHWIAKQFAFEKRQQQARGGLGFRPGDECLFLGERYVIDVRQPDLFMQDDIYLDGGRLCVFTLQDDTHSLKTTITDWQHTQANRILSEITHRYAAQIGACVERIRFGQYRSQWGSCNTKNIISYNWQLIQAPLPVVHYVAAHEVCHLRHMNHSKRFWALVETLCPDHLTQRKWLREHGHLLKV